MCFRVLEYWVGIFVDIRMLCGVGCRMLEI